MPAEASSSISSEKHALAIADVQISRDQSSSSRATNGINGHAKQDAILHPGTIKINVKGAFIVDDDASTPCSTGRTTPTSNGTKTEGVTGINEDGEYFEYQHDTQDIRLPNHTAVVSHIAIDVSLV
jgi:hypothetical protein